MPALGRVRGIGREQIDDQYQRGRGCERRAGRCHRHDVRLHLRGYLHRRSSLGGDVGGLVRGCRVRRHVRRSLLRHARPTRKICGLSSTGLVPHPALIGTRLTLVTDHGTGGHRVPAGAASSAKRTGAPISPRHPLWYWDRYLFACAIVTAGVALLLPAAAVERVGAAVALLGLYAWFRGYGRRQLRLDARNATVLFPVGTLVILAVGLGFQPMAPLGWGAVFPMLFLGCGRRAATIWAAIAATLPSIMLMFRAGPDAPFLPVSLIMGLAAGGSAILLGLWIGQMMEQSNQRAELIEQLEASRGQVELLSHEAGIVTERTRLAGEIHDTLAQGFTSIVTLVQAAESELDVDLPAARRHLNLATETARENLAEARAMVATLTPSPLASGTLAEAIRRRADLVGGQSSATVTVRLQDIGGLPMPVEVVLLRAAQEALANIGKHAGAQRITVELSEMPDTVRLRVIDDGDGFDPNEPPPGFGLAGMRKRVADVGGTLHVQSRSGGGTTVTVEVPW